MAHCPFCQAPVPQDLVTYGGPCPKCLGMIPGEEAPTDPGEAVKKAQARADDKVRQRRQRAPLLVAVPLVLITVLVAVGYALMPEPVVEPLVFDGEMDMSAVPVAYLEAPAETTTAEPRPAGGGKGGDPAPKVAKAEQPGKPIHDGLPHEPAGTGKEPVKVAGADPAPTPENATVASPPKSGGLGSISTGGPLTRQTGTLTDPDQIRDMITQRMTAQAGKLKACYEQRLKVKEDLMGRWKIIYTVTTKGTTADVSAVGSGVSDAEFEQCMVEQIKRWTFNPVNRDQPVQRTLNFKPM